MLFFLPMLPLARVSIPAERTLKSCQLICWHCEKFLREIKRLQSMVTCFSCFQESNEAFHPGDTYTMVNCSSPAGFPIQEHTSDDLTFPIRSVPASESFGHLQQCHMLGSKLSTHEHFGAIPDLISNGYHQIYITDIETVTNYTKSGTHDGKILRHELT